MKPRTILQLLIAMRDEIIIYNEKNFASFSYGLCYMASNIANTKEEYEIIKKYLNANKPSYVDSQFLYWWPQGLIEPRLSYLDDHIKKLEEIETIKKCLNKMLEVLRSDKDYIFGLCSLARFDCGLFSSEITLMLKYIHDNAPRRIKRSIKYKLNYPLLYWELGDVIQRIRWINRELKKLNNENR